MFNNWPATSFLTIFEGQSWLNKCRDPVWRWSASQNAVSTAPLTKFLVLLAPCSLRSGRNKKCKLHSGPRDCMPLGLLRIISVLPSASAMEIAARIREYGSTGIRKHGRRRHGHVQWLSLEFNLLASEIFLAVPMCRQCGFYGYSRACRSDVAPCAPGSRIPLSPPLKEYHPCHPSAVKALSWLPLISTSNAARIQRVIWILLCTFSFYLCQTICISEMLTRSKNVWL